MIDENSAAKPEALSEEALDEASGGLLPAHTGGANVVSNEIITGAGPGGGPHVKLADGSVKPGGTKGYEAWPC